MITEITENNRGTPERQAKAPSPPRPSTAFPMLSVPPAGFDCLTWLAMGSGLATMSFVRSTAPAPQSPGPTSGHALAV